MIRETVNDKLAYLMCMRNLRDPGKAHKLLYFDLLQLFSIYQVLIEVILMRENQAIHQRPNILLLFTDQQRADTIHELGNGIIQTPHMDRLCREGVAFERAYTPSPVCVPGRCSMYYGLYPHHTGCYDNDCPMPSGKPTIMQILTDAGYRTHGIGKMHFAPDTLSMGGFQSREKQEELAGSLEDDDYLIYLKNRGYQHVFDPHGQRSEMYYIPQISQMPAKDHPTQWVGDRTVEFLDQHDFSQPFFMMSSFIHPHPPFSPPTPWNKMYRAKDMPYPHLPKGAEDCITYMNRFQNRYKYRDQGFDFNLVRTQMAFYYGCISFIDYQIGRIVARLEELGQLDNTLIVLTSDHGELLGDYYSFGKRTMLDSAARIPMIARYPARLEQGKRCSKPTSLVDMMPTFMDAAGLNKDKIETDGESLFDIASETSARRYVLSQFQREGLGLYMIADENCKYVYSAPDQKEYFFDRRVDTMEGRNLACEDEKNNEMAELMQELMDVLHRSGKETSVKDGRWVTYPKLDMPADRDEWLLFQDNSFAREFEKQVPEGYSLNSL